MTLFLSQYGLRWSALVLALLALACLANVRGDEPAAQSDAAKRAEAERMRKELAEQKRRERFLQEMTSRIDEMHRLANLSEKQRKRLQIASKGAVDTYFSETKKRVESEPDGVGHIIHRLGDDWLSLDSSPHSDFVLLEPIWVKTVAETLDDRQKQILQQAASQREAFRRDFVIQGVVVKMDEELRLSQQQREQATQFLRRELSGLIAKTKMRRIRIPYFSHHAATLPAKELKTFLREEQAKQWRTWGEKFAAVGGVGGLF